MLIFSLILLQILIFVGLILVFRRILNKNIVQATRHLDELNKDYGKKEREADRRLQEAKKTAEEMVAKARKEAERQRAQLIQESETEKEGILKQARTQSEDIIRQADKSRHLLISEMEERIAKGAVDKACELIQNTLPDQFKRNVHTHWTEELIVSSLDQLKNLQIPEGIKEANVTSAFPLSSDQRKVLSKKLKQLLGRDVTLVEKTDSTIVAGLVVSIGNLVLDGSLKNRIQEHAKRSSE